MVLQLHVAKHELQSTLHFLHNLAIQIDRLPMRSPISVIANFLLACDDFSSSEQPSNFLLCEVDRRKAIPVGRVGLASCVSV